MAAQTSPRTGNRIWPETWHARALRALHDLARDQHYLTADDLHEALGEEPDNHNDWGPVFKDAKYVGFLIDTERYVHSRRSPAKERMLRIWASTYHETPGYKEQDIVGEYLRQLPTGSAHQGALF